MKQSLLTPPFAEESGNLADSRRGHTQWLSAQGLASPGRPRARTGSTAGAGLTRARRLRGAFWGTPDVSNLSELASTRQCIAPSSNQKRSSSAAKSASTKRSKLTRASLPDREAQVTRNEQKVVRDALMPSEFQVIPMASRERGFEGIYLGELGAWHAHLRRHRKSTSTSASRIRMSRRLWPTRASRCCVPGTKRTYEHLSLPAEILGDTDMNEVAEVEAEDESPQSDQVESEQDSATGKERQHLEQARRARRAEDATRGQNLALNLPPTAKKPRE